MKSSALNVLQQGTSSTVKTKASNHFFQACSSFDLYLKIEFSKQSLTCEASRTFKDFEQKYQFSDFKFFNNMSNNGNNNNNNNRKRGQKMNLRQFC